MGGVPARCVLSLSSSPSRPRKELELILCISYRGAARRGGLARVPGPEDDAVEGHLGLRRAGRAARGARYARLSLTSRRCSPLTHSARPQPSFVTSPRSRRARRASLPRLLAHGEAPKSPFHTRLRTVRLRATASTPTSNGLLRDGATAAGSGTSSTASARRRRRAASPRKEGEHGSVSRPGSTRCVHVPLPVALQPLVHLNADSVGAFPPQIPVCMSQDTPMELVVQMFQRIGLRFVLLTRQGALMGLLTRMVRPRPAPQARLPRARTLTPLSSSLPL